jgi:hypothetical protein
MLIVSAVTLLASIPVYTFVFGFVTALGVQAIDDRVDVRGALGTAWRRLPSLALTSSGAGFAIVAGLFCCCVPGMVLGVLLALPLPAVIVHGCGPVEALKRSAEVARGVPGPLAGAASITSLVWMVGNFGAQLPTLIYLLMQMFEQGPAAMLAVAEHPPLWFLGATVLEQMIGALFLVPLANTATVVYLNRTEGAHAPARTGVAVPASSPA